MQWMHPEATTFLFFPFITQVQGKTFLTSKAFMAIVGALVPEVYEIDAQEQKFLMELVNKHEGRLTSEVFKGYRKLAQRMMILPR